MLRILEMNYRNAYLNKNQRNLITRNIKKMDLEDGDHTIIIDVGKSFTHKVEILVNVFNYDGWKTDGITYKYAKMVTLFEAKFLRYQTSCGSYIPEKIITFGGLK